MTEDQICETCGYAVWFSDYSVGIDWYIDSCNAKFPSAEKHFDRCGDDETHQCPFHVMKYPDNWEYVRCSACNSPNTEFIEPMDIDNYTAKYHCNDCDEEFVADVSWR